MTKDEITQWALANGWSMIDGFPSLTKPTKPHPAIVRLVLKATVASVEIKKPAGKWEKVSGESYARIAADPGVRPTGQAFHRTGPGRHFQISEVRGMIT